MNAAKVQSAPQNTTSRNAVPFVAAVNSSIRRSNLTFQISIAAAVILLSFVYGISVGVRRHQAQASLPLNPTSGAPLALAGNTASMATSLELPANVTVLPLGDAIEINGKASEVVMFRSERAVSALVNEQIATWRGKGWSASGRTGGKRGIGFAFDPESGRRYSITVWAVPPTIRRIVADGSAVQGIVASSAGRGEMSSSPEADNGLVPGVPVVPGGTTGAMFSSVGVGGRSFSGAYTNPGTVSDNLDFYRRAMLEDGWQGAEMALDTKTEKGAGKGVGSARFLKGQEEVVLLLAPVAFSSSADASKTVVSVARGPNLGRY